MDLSTKQKTKITSYMKEAVTALQQENVTAEEPIGSRDTTNAVCHAVEAAFLHDLKGSSVDKHFWTLLKKFSHKSTCGQISALKQITTDIGRCRAWIRLAINDCALESYMHVIVGDSSALKHYYKPTAYMRDIEQPGIMLAFIQGLSEFVFNLSINSTVLNQWTSTTLVLSGLLPPCDILHPVISSPPSALSSPASAQHLQAISSSLQQVVRTHQAAAAARSASPLVFMPPIPTSTSCPQRLNRISSIVSDSLSFQLTQAEVDALTDMVQHEDHSGSGATSPSTPTSMLSHPDFADPRPDIYRFAYDVSPGCRTPADRLSFTSVDGLTASSPITEAELDQKFQEIVVAGSSSANDLGGLARSAGTEFDSQVLDTVDEEELVVYREKLPRRADHGRPGSSHSHHSSRPVSSGSTTETLSSAGGNIALPSKETAASDLAEELATDAVSLTDCCTTSENECHTTADTVQPQPETSSSSRPHKESFHSLLKNYNILPGAMPLKIPTVEEIIQSLPQADVTDRASGTNTPHTSSSTGEQQPATGSIGNADDLLLDDDDALSPHQPKPTEPKRAELEHLLSMCNEKGLNQQCYQCHGCTRPIGMFYGKERLCHYNGFYYCNECHVNDEHYIPANVIFNWDFRPYLVCKKSLEFLQSIGDEPVIHLDEVNVHLYDHVKALDEILSLRVQLHSLKGFLYSCRQPVVDEFEAKLGSKSHLADAVHVYSLRDLTQVVSGSLATRLKRLVDYGINHVYSCQLCSQKGFICELCRDPKVIYPFELSTTSKCEDCKAVFHAHCKTKLVPCPRCTRRQSAGRRQSDPVERISFSFPSDTLVAS